MNMLCTYDFLAYNFIKRVLHTFRLYNSSTKLVFSLTFARVRVNLCQSAATYQQSDGGQGPEPENPNSFNHLHKFSILEITILIAIPIAFSALSYEEEEHIYQ